MARDRIDLLDVPPSAGQPVEVDPATEFGRPKAGQAGSGKSGPGIKAEEGGTSNHTQVLIDSRYYIDPGHLVVSPASADGAPAEVVKLHAATITREVTWTAERKNEPPVVPHWDTGSPNEVLLPGSYIEPCDPLDGPEGSRVWRVSGFYRYQCLRLPFTLAQFGPWPTGVGGHTTATQADNTLPLSFVQRGMIGALGVAPKAIF